MKKRDYALVVITLIVVTILSLNSISDFDTGYHLANGKFILANGFIPTHDVFSYTAVGATWVNHYWLSDVFFYLAYHGGGPWGLIVMVALIAALTYAFVLASTFLRTKNKTLALLLLIPYGVLTYELWVARPQVMTYSLTAVVIYIFEKWRNGGSERILLLLPIILFLWGNLHAGVLMGIGIIGFYLLNELWLGKDRKTKIYLGILSALSVASTFLNPNGYKVLTYDLIIGSTASQLGVAEWKSLVVYLGSWQANSFLALMVLVLIFCLYGLLRKKDGGWESVRDTDWPSVGLLATAFILPLISIRHVGFFPILTFPIFIRSLEKVFPKIVEVAGRNAKIAVFIFLVVFLTDGIARAAELSPIDDHVLPVGAEQFIQSQNLQGPMFNDEAFGGYLIWQGWPQQKVFIDGRDEVYAGQVADDYIDIMETNTDWVDLVNNRYRINYFILWYNPPLSGLVENLSDQLEQKLGFKLVYWDDAAIVLVRDDAQNQAIINKFSYNYISPFVPAQSIPLADRPEAVKELYRAINISPDSVILQNYL